MHTDKHRWVFAARASCPCLFLLMASFGCSGLRQSVALFNGTDLNGWYTYTTATKSENPGIFVAEDGVLKIHGGDGTRAYYGGIYTNQAYDNYKLSVEYMFAGPTHGDRTRAARDSGLLLHCNGKPQGATWEGSIEANVMEGDTGSFWLVGNRKAPDIVDDAGNTVKLAITVEAEKGSNGEWYYKPGAPPVRLEGKDKFCNPVYKQTTATDTLGY